MNRTIVYWGLLGFAILCYLAAIGCMFAGIWLDDYYLRQKIVKTAFPLFALGVVAGAAAAILPQLPWKKAKK